MVGNKPNFNPYDILRCLFRIEEGISRQLLAKSLELGEGTIRTILDILKDRKLIESSKKGHFLSSQGRNALNDLKKSISLPKKIESEHIYKNLRKCGIALKGVKELANTYRLRDIAVKNGSEGALILKFEKRLYAPESDYDYSWLEKSFELESGDILALAFADSYSIAENSALAVASELNPSLKSFINRLSH
ncbi:hypothetical protein HYT54_03155 [Candidatus Woesearchaeota archaeon]|nr:hypothetical protein [Candidatus Woesearchaeota archaeon]